MILKGLPVDVKDEHSPHFTQFLVKINSGFDAANWVSKGFRENRSSGVEGNASFILSGFVECDFDRLALC